MISKNLIYLILLMLMVRDMSTQQLSETRERDKRGVIFRLNSATGILIAIAVPLDLPKRSVFMSYNFEANYNMPTISQDIAPGIWQRLDLPGLAPVAEAEGRSDFSNDSNNTDTTHKTKRNIGGSRGSLLSRMKTYKILESKLNTAGFNGTECLLRAICDNAAAPVNISNGVLGDIIHIILTPSTSLEENLNQFFYEAETNGRQTNKNCESIYKFCPTSVFDRLSKVL